MTVPSMNRQYSKITWTCFYLMLLMDAAIKMGKSITCHGGALWLIFPHSDSRLCFITESTDVGAIVHNSQVNYEAANWSCANILPIIADHHLGESRSGSDSWKRLWHSGELLSIIAPLDSTSHPPTDAQRVRKVGTREEEPASAHAGNLKWTLW